jgi:Fe-S-cluster containining protein
MPGDASIPSQSTASERRFACTSCGVCCNSGPEMELSEATALADKFITTLHLRVWALPLPKGSKRADQGAPRQGSILTDEAALEADRRHIGHFSLRDKIDRSNGRSLHLTISARTVDREKGRCPALIDKRCGIYEDRPLSCRAVPLHFSKPDALLARSLDAFVRLPGHLCDTSAEAPVVFDGERVTDTSMQQARADALNLAKSDLRWKKEILSVMDNPAAALAAGLPTYEEVVRHSDSGLAGSVSMLAAWRVAKNAGIIAPRSFEEICEKQIALLKLEIARVANLELAARLVTMLSGYESAYATARPRLPLLSPGDE